MNEFLDKVDWKLLREQKEFLYELALSKRTSDVHTEALDGVISLLDEFQDTAEKLGYNVYDKYE